jgi:AraC family transcriptional regulator, regulatory protein of adaptative response / methylated-DNA-[protein]-cysteine methyltransferase
MKRFPQNSVNDADWNSVAKRDRHHDGEFVYAAVTTGIYCRPSCPARHPHRRNTVLFRTAEEAEREGFIPCGRCSPGPNSLSLAEKCVKAVLNYLDTHSGEKITLFTLSRITGLCPNHFQQTFKRIVGVSPKAFCDFRRLRAFKQLLKRGESISTAIYEAGYESSRAVYEKSNKTMGMTPSTYQRGGAGVTVRYSIANAAMGRVLIACTELGICAVVIGEDDKHLIDDLQGEFPKAILIRDKITAREWIAATHTCQVEDPMISKLPSPLRKQVFEVKMWKTLQQPAPAPQAPDVR